MSEVLSQNEIDALLNALNSGEVDVKEIKEETKTKKIRTYDFRNPQKMGKDQLRTLEIIHDNFGRLLQTFLSGYLRAQIKTSLLSVEQYAYSEFSNALSNPSFISIINLEPLTGDSIIEISPEIAFVIIDRLLGGDGEKASTIRVFTEIEITLLKKIINKLLKLLAQAWENVVQLKPSLEKVETNPQFAQIVSPNETIALITFSISIGNIDGMINVCIPHIVLEPIINKLTTKLWFTSAKTKVDSLEDNSLLHKRIKSTSVLLKAELGRATLSVSEILDLQIGDVVKLDTFEDNLAQVAIGSNLKYHCEPGLTGNNLAIKISRVIKDGDDADD